MDKHPLKILILALGLSFIFLGQTNPASAQSRGGACNFDKIQAKMGGDVPFPWGSEVPFPWNGISGLWAAEKGNMKAFFRFSQVRRMSNGEWIVEVEEVLPGLHEVIATGAGVAPDSGRIVRATMTGVDNSSYNAIVRAYREFEKNGVEKIVVVLTIRYADGRADSHFVLERQ